ncbi:MAG: [Ruminococcus sp.]|nr:[FeFe] hydrogenase H-cluster maturation GTPase HydF [Ruminococcus sp.]
MNESTPSAQRIHIGFFGCTNAGKSSLINAIAGQEVSIVSNVKGTTTDPVRKAMELLPLGAVMLFDTAGLDDESPLGLQRTAKTYEILRHTDLAVLVVDAVKGITEADRKLEEKLRQEKIPYGIAFNKWDLNPVESTLPEHAVAVSAESGFNIPLLKRLICTIYLESKGKQAEQPLLGDLITKESIVILVTPIDESAPKGRMILPQVQSIRAILDVFAVCITVQPDQLPFLLNQLKNQPDLVITDSQVFSTVKDMIPKEVPLTSFSILFARYKGILEQALEGIQALDKLRDGDCVLIAEGCTHHRQCGDIGTVKLPEWISEYTGRNLNFTFSSGNEFPEDLSPFALAVHCGGCMLNVREMQHRRLSAQKQNIPFTNYGILIAAVNGILNRSISALGIPASER